MDEQGKLDSNSGDMGTAAGGSLPGAIPAAAGTDPANAAGAAAGAQTGSTTEIPGVAEQPGAEIKKIGKKNFAAVYIAASEADKLAGKQGTVVRLSDQEAVVLRTFLNTYDYQATAEEAGIEVSSVKRILRRPALRAAVQDAILKVAANEGVDLSWTIKENRLVWEGHKKVDSIKMQAMKNIIDVLRPRGPGIQVGVSVQQNSVYSGKTKDELNAEWTDARRTATP